MVWKSTFQRHQQCLVLMELLFSPFFLNLHQISPRHADEEDEQVAAAAMKELEMLMPNFCGTSSANR